MSFVYGVIGTLSVLLLFLGGVFVGYKLRGKMDDILKPKVGSPEEKELRRQEELQRAYNLMQNYSPEMAYGVTANPFEGGDEGI